MARLAARQHGVVSIRQLEGVFGFSAEAVRKSVVAGRLHRVHHGVYAVGHTELSIQGECLAAVLAVGPGSLLSYWSAGWLWGLIRPHRRPFHVTATGPRRLRDRPPIRVHRARNLVEEDRALIEGIPVTSLARTLLDLAEVLPRDRLTRVLKRAEELRDPDGVPRFDFYAAVAVVERSRGHRGAKRLRKALALHRPTVRVLRSDVERDFLSLLETAGLPLPSSNYVVGAYELDAYWPGAGLAVEIDTYETHGTRASFESDRRRDAELAAVAITVVRVTERRLEEEPEAIARQLAGLLRPGAAPRRRASRPSPV